MARFRTKRGACFVSDGKIRLDESYRDQLNRYYEEARRSNRGLVLVTALFVSLLLMAFYTARAGPEMLPYLLGFATILGVLGYTADRVRGFRRVETISCEAITAVRAIERSRATHPRFVVKYEDAEGTHRRRIKLPSRHFPDTEREFERAKQLFRSNGVPLEASRSRANGG